MRLKVRKLDPSALIGELEKFEHEYSMTSSDFYARYREGTLGDSSDFVHWAGLCYVAMQNGALAPVPGHV